MKYGKYSLYLNKSGRTGSDVANAVSIELKNSDAIATGGEF